MRYLAVTGLLGGTALASFEFATPDTFDNATLIKAAARLVTSNLASYYHGTDAGEILGILPGPPTYTTSPNTTDEYSWWESGAMWDTLISYWHDTGDAQYNDLITQGLLSQVGPGNDFMPPNWTASLGNDDQGFWAMAAMTAAETGLPNDGAQEGQDWLDLVKNVFETQVHPDRWNESESCGGGLRWQIARSNAGYDYKNSASQAVLFNVAARLARFTGNQTYADWAEKVWTWMESVGLMYEDEQGGIVIYDGAQVDSNCTSINKIRWSYTAGVFLQGAAFMYNQSLPRQSVVWRERINKLYSTTANDFFIDSDSVLVEFACESHNGSKTNCTTDMRAFKGITLRTLTSVAQLALFTYVDPFLLSTATAASRLCDNQTGECGFTWYSPVYDGSQRNWITKNDGLRGAGEQMNALSAFLGALSVVLQDQVAAPLTSNSSAGPSTPASSGTGPSSTAVPTPGGATITGASVGSVLGGLLLVAAFFA